MDCNVKGCSSAAMSLGQAQVTAAHGVSALAMSAKLKDIEP